LLVPPCCSGLKTPLDVAFERPLLPGSSMLVLVYAAGSFSRAVHAVLCLQVCKPCLRCWCSPLTGAMCLFASAASCTSCSAYTVHCIVLDLALCTPHVLLAALTRRLQCPCWCDTRCDDGVISFECDTLCEGALYQNTSEHQFHRCKASAVTQKWCGRVCLRFVLCHIAVTGTTRGACAAVRRVQQMCVCVCALLREYYYPTGRGEERGSCMGGGGCLCVS
jgi:hypothetical protein